MAELTRPEQRRAVLEQARTIAVLGAHSERQRAAFYVPDYLHRAGYRVLPVNPTLDVDELWGEPVVGTLAELDVGVDVVDVFRRSSVLAGHLDDLLAMHPAPPVVWLQVGVRDQAFTDRLVEAGFDVVQDQCTMADHRRFGLARSS